MKALRLISFLFALSIFLTPTHSHAEKMRPLEDSVSANSGIQGLAYLARRCTALNLALHSRFKNSGQLNIDDLLQAYWNSYMAWAAIAINVTMQEPAENTMEFFQKSIMRTSKGYNDAWDSNYDLTGSAFGEMTMADQGYCNEALKIMQKSGKN